jgi:hypothetical protein
MCKLPPRLGKFWYYFNLNSNRSIYKFWYNMVYYGKTEKGRLTRDKTIRLY